MASKPESNSFRLISCFASWSLRPQNVNVFAVLSGQMDDTAIKGSENQPIQHGVTEQISICDLFVAV